jgi:hypothetical protein
MKKLAIILFIVALPFVACEDVLETVPQGSLDVSINNEDITEALVTAAYNGLGANIIDVRNAFVGPTTNWVMDVRSDDAYTGGEGAAVLEYSGLPQMERGQINTDDVDGDNLHIPLSKWRNALLGIARCNTAIRSINDLESADYPKEIRIAEMRLLRGFFHFDMKRNFDRIPYINESDDPTTIGNRTYTSEEIWSFIEEDFQFAMDNLPMSQDEIARLNSYVAAAMLTKLYVETERWTEAIAMADIVISGPYDLQPRFEDLATLEHENGPESVFAIQFSLANSSGEIYPNHNFCNLLNGPRGLYSGDGFFLASQNLANAFRTGDDGLPLFNTFNNEIVTGSDYTGNLDPRIDFTMGRLGIPWKEAANFSSNWVRSTTFFPQGRSGKKHIVSPNDPNIKPSGTINHGASGLNFILIRFAEVLLWKAEASAELGNLSDAEDLVNQVRARAADSQYWVRTLDGSTFAANYVINQYPSGTFAAQGQQYAINAVRFERRLELAMEGHRWYDIQRWGIAQQVMENYFSTEIDRAPHLEGSTLIFNPAQQFLPIPQNEIDLAPDLYVQNEGYL